MVTSNKMQVPCIPTKWTNKNTRPLAFKNLLFHTDIPDMYYMYV